MKNEFTKNYVPYTRDELTALVKKQLKQSRFEHCLRVAKTASKLAEQNGVDPELAEIAGLLHDYAKQRSAKTFLKVIADLGLDPNLVNYGNGVWHGVVGAELIKSELHIYNEAILDAVRLHTVGAPYMSKLAQIVFMADFIEPNRDFPGVDEARKLTKKSLASGVRYQIQHTLAYLVANGQAVYPQTLATYNAWVGQVGQTRAQEQGEINEK